LRIHLLAGRLESVLVIAGSILLCAALLGCATDCVVPFFTNPITLIDAAPRLIRQEAWAVLAGVLTGWVLWWSVIGGAITRRMALVIEGSGMESWWASLRWCLRPGLLVPSLLASLCLLAVAVVAAWPWYILAMPVVWLIAGVLYAGLCLPPGRLDTALHELMMLARNPVPFLRRQVVFLLGFAVSTGLVYLMVAGWWSLMRVITGSWSAPLTLMLTMPALIFALGYTTANLKSLQIWLYLRRNLP